MKKIGIFGGTFDPVHWGHLALANAAVTQAALDQLIWVPMRQPPHKTHRVLTSFDHRLAMLQAAIADVPHYSLSRVESHRIGPSFAIATLEDLQQQYPNAQWSWVIGLDAFRSLPQWYRSQDLVAHCNWLVAPRPPEMPEAVLRIECQRISEQLLHQTLRWQILQLVPAPALYLSSSQVRQAYCDQRSIKAFVPKAVEAYIVSHCLYG